MSHGLSRRGWFELLVRPLKRAGTAPPPQRPSTSGPTAPPQNRVAIIQGRFCIALTSFCSVCVERCPVPGAIRTERGMPMVVPDVCTGCGVCHDVCPAPRNAVLMLPRPPGARNPAPAPPS